MQKSNIVCTDAVKLETHLIKCKTDKEVIDLLVYMSTDAEDLREWRRWNLSKSDPTSYLFDVNDCTYYDRDSAYSLNLGLVHFSDIFKYPITEPDELDAFTVILRDKGYDFSVEGEYITVYSTTHIDLQEEKSIPPNVTFKTKGTVYLDNLEVLPPNTRFKGNRFVYLSTIQVLPDCVVFDKVGEVFLDNLRHVPNANSFKVTGNLFMRNLMYLPDASSFNVGNTIFLKTKQIKKEKGKKMKTVTEITKVVTTEVKGLMNERGAADITIGKVLYSNVTKVFGRTIVKIPLADKIIGKVSKKMRLKNEVVQLGATLGALVIIKQFYDHKLVGHVRGYIVHRLYEIAVEASGIDDVVALVHSHLGTSETAEA